ncbi:hypothetical protein [Spirosoma pollinicola]|uniref:Uncharacterized protein n=1 Tax=Spirosoma pollinicola TaxID=2057025 RepID=A0A2K8Z634_9BACT|nr:hypothetical protein [Spirosoma pollinicola]AUD05335.1 hypothetical protein CWM47_27880 [Spirosoma pollinicola]
MKRYLNHVIGLLALIFICQALSSRPTGNFQDDTNIAITQQLTKKAALLKFNRNYFMVKSVAFLTESNRQIAGQQQKGLTFCCSYETVKSNALYKAGDSMTGKDKALFVTDNHDHWHLHRITVK